MKNELQSLNERIAERIRSELIDFIPQDEWQSIVNTEINKFRTVTIPEIIEELLREAYMYKIKVEIGGLITSHEWDTVTGSLSIEI